MSCVFVRLSASLSVNTYQELGMLMLSYSYICVPINLITKSLDIYHIT